MPRQLAEGDVGTGEAAGSRVIGGENEDSKEDGEGLGGSPEGREVKWGLLPEGLQIASKPAALDGSLLGQLIYMRSDAPHGWLVGTIKETFDQSTPRLFKKIEISGDPEPRFHQIIQV